MLRNPSSYRVYVVFLAVSLGSMPSGATEPPTVGQASSSVTVLQDVKIKDLSAIPSALFLANFFGWDARLTVMMSRTPFNDRLPGNGKARGRADVAVDCFGTNVTGASLGRFRPRFDADAGVAVQSRQVSGNRGCLGYDAIGGLRGNQTQPEGSTVTLDLNVQLLPPGVASACFDEATLCLNQGRFMLNVDWRDAAGNRGEAVGLASADNAGHFYFLDPNNIEMLIKVVDGCNFNDHFWVFYGAATDVEYTLRVTDTQTNTVKQYFNPLGQASPAITDTSAFATCP